jgi:hypothetical protein
MLTSHIPGTELGFAIEFTLVLVLRPPAELGSTGKLGRGFAIAHVLEQKRW